MTSVGGCKINVEGGRAAVGRGSDYREGGRMCRG